MADQTTDLRCYLTDSGIAAENLVISKGLPLPVKELVFGSGLLDDDKDPSKQTALLHEEATAPCALFYDPDNPKKVTFKADLKADIGGFYINEIAVRLENGDLYGYARGTGDYKPIAEQGSTDSSRYAVDMYTDNADIIECVIDMSHIFVDFDDLDAAFNNHEQADNPHSQYLLKDDKSVTNARDWDAEIIPQTEAEKGESNTPRKWTAQRTRQALVAWWSSIPKGTAFNKNFGSTEDTVCRGNDTRLSNSRDWTAEEVSQKEAETGTAATVRKWSAQRVSQLVTAWWNRSPMKTKLDGIQAGAQVNRAFGSIAGTICQGNDARLSNAREWNAELVSQMEAETGTTATVRKWSAQRVSQLVTAWWNRSPMKTKLDGIQAGAQVNQAFGSTAGTTCQGNDIRLNNAREWTADLISQAEAAAGSATIARKWSAQRVRQAIDARVPNTDSSINTYALCLHKQEAGLSPVAGQLISAAKLMRCNAAGTAIATTGGTWRLMTPISINSTNPVERVGLFIRVN